MPLVTNLKTKTANREGDPLDDARAAVRGGKSAAQDGMGVLQGLLFGQSVYEAMRPPLDRMADALWAAERAYESTISGYHAELDVARDQLDDARRRLAEATALLTLAVEHTRARYAKAHKDVPAWVVEAEERFTEVPF